MMSDVGLEDGAGDGASRRRRRLAWVGAAAAVGVVAFVLVWFQPQKLFIDERIEEAIPTAGAPPSTSTDGGAPSSTPGPTVPAPQVPVELARGEFVSLDHGTSGVARVLELADGRRIVRVEGLDTDNGPDLFLYLTANPANGDEGAFDDAFLDLGRLKGNQGDQNYDLPADADLAQLQTIVIWCDRFDSAFGAADLMI